MKMTFEEWFDASNPEHMAIAMLFFKHKFWHYKLDNLDQTNRHMWPIILYAKLANRYIELYDNPKVKNYLENFTKSVIT
jgi:hypothetical protein